MLESLAIFLIGFAAFIINLPLGRWRASVKKFSLPWFLALHLSVPVIFLLRVETGLGLYVIPVTISFAILGQMVGGSNSNEIS